MYDTSKTLYWLNVLNGYIIVIRNIMVELIVLD